MCLLFKIIHGKVDLNFDEYFTFNTANTRGHPLKLNMVSSRINCHKYHFFNRVVKVWNFLPVSVVMADNFCDFKKNIYNIDVTNFCTGRAFT